MSTHPYKSLPNSAFWKRSIATIPPDAVDPVVGFDLNIQPSHLVATAGSCFAQHISKRLSSRGLNYFVAEKPHPILTDEVAKANNYGTFSARYGNIYTARQLLQLAHRAYSLFTPVDDFWTNSNGSIVDAFRPTIQPGGFISREEAEDDRRQHFAAVRAMFEQLDVFVFTLGLTECWRSRSDLAVYPICPGVDGGNFDDQKYEFYNQSVNDVICDLDEFLAFLKEKNPTASVIFTVSPVPLMATAAPNSGVLMSTTYSKSVLRVAAEEMRQKHDNVYYFPSYEIITGAFSRGLYYAEDLRNINDMGVDHVMRLFMKHAYGDTVNEMDVRTAKTASTELKPQDAMRQFQQLICDEEKLDF